MNTNDVPVIQSIAQHAGLNISGPEIGMAVVAVRWLHLEIPVWINAYSVAGGWRGIFRFLNTGSTQPQPKTP